MNPVDKAKTRIYAQDRCYPENVEFLTIYPKVSQDLYQAAYDIQNILNIDESKDLDLIGRVVGIGRIYESNPIKYHSIGYKASVCGNKYAQCHNISWDNAPDLANEYYRKILKAKVIKNNSEVTIPDIERGVRTFVSSSNVNVVDHQDMTFSIIFIGRLTEIERDVIKSYDVIPRPAGVEFLGYTETAISARLGKSFAVCGNRMARCGSNYTQVNP